MKSTILRVLTIGLYIISGLTALEAIPFVPMEVSVVILAVAASIRDIFSKVGDLLDDGEINQSFKPKR